MARKRTLKLLSRDELNALFRYEPETGKLFWRKRPRMMFTTADACKGWNARFADKEAFTFINKGYPRGSLMGRQVYAHQVIWKMVLGADVAEVDHIDGNRQNNIWKNLRPALAGVNQRNSARRKDNTSGCVGVVRRSDRWIAQFGNKGTTIHLGVFDTFEKAVAARKAAELAYGFHPNHGRTPTTGDDDGTS